MYNNKIKFSCEIIVDPSLNNPKRTKGSILVERDRVIISARIKQPGNESKDIKVSLEFRLNIDNPVIEPSEYDGNRLTLHFNGDHYLKKLDEFYGTIYKRHEKK